METRTGFLISQIKRVQDRIFERLLQDCGIEEFNGAQGRILYLLWQEDSVPISDLVRKTGLAKNTLTSVLGRMEESGLLHRAKNENDRRQAVITLTEKARGMRESYEAVSQQMNRLFYRGFQEEEAALLDSLLDRVLENLQETEKNLKKETEYLHGKDTGKNRK